MGAKLLGLLDGVLGNVAGAGDDDGLAFEGIVLQDAQGFLGVVAQAVAGSLGASQGAAEFEALAVHVVGERLQGLVSVGPDVLRNLPVAEAGGVVTAGAEPAIVHDESFDAAFHGLVCERGQGVVIVVEVDGFPRVEDDRTWSTSQSRCTRRM